MRLFLPSGSGRGVLVEHHIEKTRQRACSKAEARRVYRLQFITFAGRQVGFEA